MGAKTGSAKINRRKIAAISAGVLVLGVGATYTLATWNDSEWVWGGNSAGNGPGVGTSTFEVLQNTTSPYDDDSVNWSNEESNPGGGLTFTTGALSLSPGDTVYAPVALRTDTVSEGATVTLQSAVAATGITVNDTGGNLWDAVTVNIYTSTGANPAAACDATNIGSWTTVIAGVTDLDTVATDTQTLAANAGSTQHYCFALTLDTTGLNQTQIDALQGRTIAPAWEFKAVSVES